MIFHIYIGLPQCLILPDGCANWSTCHHELFDQPQTNHHFMVFWWEDHCRETRGFKVCDFCTHPLSHPRLPILSQLTFTHRWLATCKTIASFRPGVYGAAAKKTVPSNQTWLLWRGHTRANGHCEKRKIMVPNRGFSSKPCLIMFEGMFEGTGSAQWLGLLVGRIRKTK